jgi:hypothetical protein
MYERSVIVEHQEGADWALVLVANRNAYGRRYIVPMIFANDGCGLFAVCPNLKSWIRAGLVFVYNPPPDRREELLKNAVAEFVRAVSLRTNILERSRVGIVARAKARPQQFDDPPQGFSISEASEPALWWLCGRSENAVQAMRVLRYLIGKHKLGELTRAEAEALGERLIKRGEEGHVFYQQR